MVIENISDWLKAFLVVGIPAILFCLALAGFTRWASRRLQAASTVAAFHAGQKRIFSGKVPVSRLTIPWYNRFLVYAFVSLAVIMALLWAAKLITLLVDLS